MSHIRSLYRSGFFLGFHKYAGGPGSGVKGHNVATINLPKSDYVSVGTRKSLLDNMDYEEEDVPLDKITHVAQYNFVPDKLQKMLRNPEFINTKPIDLLKVKEQYHVCDGHHRFLAAKSIGLKTIPARVRTKSDKTFQENKK